LHPKKSRPVADPRRACSRSDAGQSDQRPGESAADQRRRIRAAGNRSEQLREKPRKKNNKNFSAGAEKRGQEKKRKDQKRAEERVSFALDNLTFFRILYLI